MASEIIIICGGDCYVSSIIIQNKMNLIYFRSGQKQFTMDSVWSGLSYFESSIFLHEYLNGLI